jgi:Carboxypeptidase regulatory-like domain
MRKSISAVCLAIALLFALPVAAQVTTADIVGRVLDPKGLAVAGAKVTVANTETGLKRETLTGDTGDYAVTLLPVGTYKVTVEKEGFAKTVVEKLELTVGAKQTLDVTLKVGAITEVVTITEQPPLIESTRSEVGGSVSPAEVKDLPVRDRNFASLMALIPGVSLAQNFDPTKSRSGNVSVNGGDGRAFDYNVDGGDNKDNVIGGIVQNFTLEGIQEFNVIINRYTAESGRTVGGVVNVVTKSGTNHLHGSLFSQFQVNTLNAKSEFETVKPNYHRYHLGGSIGGPVIKDKLFFFGAYEYKRELAKISADPTAFANLALVPFAQATAQIPTPYFDHLATVKTDWHISDRQNMFFRYGRERWVSPNDQGTAVAGSTIADLTEANDNINQFHSLVMQHNFTVSANKLNSFSFQFQDFVNAIPATPTRTFTLPVAGGGTTTNPLVTFPDAELGQNGNVPQQTLIRKYQFRDDFSWSRGRHNMKFGANYIYAAKVGGFFFFGANGYEVDFFDDPLDIFGSKKAFYPQGLATRGALSAITFSTGSGRTDNQERPHFLAFYYQDDFKVTPRLTLNLGIRWDANIRFLPKQLRDTPTTSNRSINALRAIIAANAASPLPASAADGLARAKFLAGNVDDLTRTTANWKEFQPRVGFAWDPTGSGKMVIRGGYGIARDQVFQNLTLFSIQQSNPTLYQTAVDLESSLGPADAGGPSGDLATFRFGVDPLPTPAAALTDLAFGGRGRINDPRMTDPWAQQASIGWSWQFSPDFAFSADYYHVLGTHEPRVLNDNPKISSICNPTFGGNSSDPRCVRGTGTRLLDAAFKAANVCAPVIGGIQCGAGRLGELRNVSTENRSLFDSINFQVKKRMSHNFLMQANYVASWSRSWGGRPSASYGGTAQAIAREFQFRAGEFGPTNSDVRHRFSISGIFNLPYGFELAPILKASSASPINFIGGKDIDGDGRKTIDRVCVGSTVQPLNVITTPGCQQVQPNSVRVQPFFQLDLAAAKRFKFGEQAALRLFWEFHNLTNRFNKCNAVQDNATSGSFLTPLQGPISGPYCAGRAGFGPGFSSPFRSQFGFRFEF